MYFRSHYYPREKVGKCGIPSDFFPFSNLSQVEKLSIYQQQENTKIHNISNVTKG